MANMNLYDMTDAWTDGSTYTSIKMNVTDTSSNAASLLMDFQVGGTSKFKVGKNGRVDVAYVTSGIGVQVTGNGNGFVASSTGSDTTSINGYGVRLQASNTIEWANSVNGITGGDTILSRKGVANIQIGRADAASPVAQTLGVQSVVAGTTNTAGANFTIKGSAGTGNAAGGSIVFQVAPAGTTGSSQNSFADALTIDSNKYATLADGGRIVWGSGTSYTSAGSGLPVTNGSVGGNIFWWGNFGASLLGLALPVANMLGWGSAASSGNIDVRLYRDAANTLALRNSTNAQTSRVYETYTDASNGRWVSIEAAAVSYRANGTGINNGTFYIGNEQASGPLAFRAGASTRWQLTSAGHFLAGADNTYDIGASGATRPRSIYAGTSVTPSAAVAVSALPTPVLGMMAQVNDATAPVVGSTVTGGGAAAALVWYNGSNWTVIGV